MTEVGFFFNHNERIYQLPVNPEKLEVQYPGDTTTKDIISLGEIIILKGRKLSKLSIQSWLPENPWYSGIRTSGEFLTATVYDEFFRMVQESKEYIRLVVTGLGVNMLVAITNYKSARVAGAHEDIQFTLDLQEYRPYNARQIPITNENIAITRRNILALGSNGAGGTGTGVGVPTQITIGSLVLVTGKLYATSGGVDAGGKTLRNYTGRISHINNLEPYPYHITTPDGGWLGWVSKNSVKLA